MQEILEKYQVRKTNKEKTKFISYLKRRLQKSEYNDNDIKIEERWKWILNTRNIVVGNPETAKIFLTAHYDTCALSPLPNFMFPTNPIMFFLSQMLLVFLMFFVAFWVMVPFALYVENPNACIYAFEYTCIAFCIQIAFGFKNKHTANDNTSGTITLIKILENLPKEDRNKVCVVFFDNEEKGLFGSSFFAKKHPKTQGKLLINFDCVGDGDRILMMAKQKAKNDKLYEILDKTMKDMTSNTDIVYLSKPMRPLMFASDQSRFDKGIGVCALRKSIFGLYAGRIHTPFDTKCRKENISYLTKSIINYLKKLEN